MEFPKVGFEIWWKWESVKGIKEERERNNDGERGEGREEKKRKGHMGREAIDMMKNTRKTAKMDVLPAWRNTFIKSLLIILPLLLTQKQKASIYHIFTLMF
ncbi:hypothetical protein M5689_003691 [Euphorbia peplus]|nr:hypothetical protein M5689_003691 [Euphorbia peplus]